MGAKTWMLIYADDNPAEALRMAPSLDEPGSLKIARLLFPREKLEPLEPGDLSNTCPPDGEIHLGRFPGVVVVAAKEFGGDYPSKLPPHFLGAYSAKNVYLHAMHSVVDWFAFAHWAHGSLVRSLSVSPDSGILEDIGTHLPFEEPFWSGERPAVDPEEEPDGYPLPFHPLELGEQALLSLFGYQLEGAATGLFDPENVPLMRFRRARPWWRFRG